MDPSQEPINTHPSHPVDDETATSSKPRKLIISNTHLQAFIESATHADVVQFIENLNDSIIGLPLDHPVALSDSIEKLLEILQKIKQIALSHPPVDNKASRFGNPAFREFYDQLDQESEILHSSLDIPEDKRVELSTYLTESWGNRSRIDYGSGMELNFLCWLICLKKLNVFGTEDYPAVVLKVFWKYIEVMRYLQSTYWLEPAGSHGLRNHKYLKPKSIHDPDVLEGYSPQYMYLACIQFINSIKTASLRWHSPMLDDISGVKTWDKVNSGMIKMYKAEVLAKLPVAQHFLFGSLLPFPDVDLQEVDGKNEDSLVVDHAGHLHIKEPGDPTDPLRLEVVAPCTSELVPRLTLSHA
ncbi:hypothetical protein H4Q26_017181 [Puccinia striiformis f. sp. tritici PST-130]|nr:hypothetical protein H4Q26_017181 [Puccinia striiformis f. sp. tritici PST-130]